MGLSPRRLIKDLNKAIRDMQQASDLISRHLLPSERGHPTRDRHEQSAIVAGVLSRHLPLLAVLAASLRIELSVHHREGSGRQLVGLCGPPASQIEDSERLTATSQGQGCISATIEGLTAFKDALHAPLKAASKLGVGSLSQSEQPELPLVTQADSSKSLEERQESEDKVSQADFEIVGTMTFRENLEINRIVLITLVKSFTVLKILQIERQ